MNKILLVEDDPFIKEMYIAKIEQEGIYEIINVGDGETALDEIKTIKPDLVLLDIVLPKMDGFTVLKRIKQEEETKNIPVIILSNLGHKNDVEKGFSLGADEYIIKTHFTPEEVLKKIKEILK